MTKEENQHTVDDVFDKIQKLIDDKNVHIFDDDEVIVIKEMINVYTSVQAFGRVGNWFKNIMVGLAAMIGTYYAIHNWGAEVFKNIISLLIGAN